MRWGVQGVGLIEEGRVRRGWDRGGEGAQGVG